MDEMIDHELQGVGVKFTDRTKEVPVDADGEPAFENHVVKLAASLKFPALFLTLTAFIGWTAQMDLMAAVIAVPGMCVCSACFGWHIKK